MTKCCDKPKYRNGHIVWKIFKVKVCINCGEATTNMSPLAEFLFIHIFSKLWEGIITLDD